MSTATLTRQAATPTTNGVPNLVGPILVALAIVVALMTLLHAQQQAVGRRLDAKRKPYRDPVTGQWIRYATIADLPEPARNERMWQDSQMNRWFTRQYENELEWIVNQSLRRGRLRGSQKRGSNKPALCW